MTKEMQFGAGVWMFGQFVDRYATDGYGPPVGTLEAIDRAGQVGDLKFLDINYPFSDPSLSVESVREALDRNGLRAIAVTPVIYNRQFMRGSFTHPDEAVRRKAIDLGKRAIDVAHKLDADYVKFWPGQDGYDYPFQADYRKLWELAVSGVREVAETDPQMQFAIEYKAKEPRVHIFFETAAKTLLAIEDMGVDNVGIVMDLGHSLFAKETPAEALQLISGRGKLVSVELNDNWREWDDDLTVGSVHLIETLEFLHHLRLIGWTRPLLLDQFPFREDPVEAARTSIRNIRLLDNLLEESDLSELLAAQSEQNALRSQQFVLQLLLGRGGIQ
jgi:xylose isomerase